MTIVKKRLTIPLEMDVFLKENFISPSKLLQRAIRKEMMKQEQKKPKK